MPARTAVQTQQAPPSSPGMSPGQEPRQQQQAPGQQQMEQEQQAQEQQAQQANQQHPQVLLTGKIMKHGKHYVFHDQDSNTNFRITNSRKAKKYSGQDVKVQGTVNQTAQTIHITKIARAS